MYFQVRMVVARPVEPSSADFQNVTSTAPIVPTKLLTDPLELEKILSRNGICTSYAINGIQYENEEITQLEYETSNEHCFTLTDLKVISQNNINAISPVSGTQLVLSPLTIECAVPETERFTVELTKNECGLGITIAGYVCEREDLSGIFVKSLNEGSEAYKCGKINLNDRIVEVDGESLQDFSNYKAVEKLKQTGDVVRLTLERYLHGPKYEQLQEALAYHDKKDLSPPSPSVTTLSWIPIDTEVLFLCILFL